jgi:hypothetical protein
MLDPETQIRGGHPASGCAKGRQQVAFGRVVAPWAMDTGSPTARLGLARMGRTWMGLAWSWLATLVVPAANAPGSKPGASDAETRRGPRSPESARARMLGRFG